MPLNPKVAIIVLNYKNYEDTLECLRSLAAITYPDTELYVVDNDSRNDSLGHIQRDLSARRIAHAVITENEIDAPAAIRENTVLIQASRNLGYAGGNNLGIRLALARGADAVLILNNDTLVGKDFLEPLVRYAGEHEQVGSVGPKVLDTKGQIERSCARRRITPWHYFFTMGIGKRLFPVNYWTRRHTYQGEYPFDCPREVDVLSGCCMLIKSSVLHRLGMLDENTFLFAEEFILHEQLRGIGLVSAIVPDSVIVHKHGQSTAREPPRSVKDARLASLRYYLTHYRHYNRFTVAAILLSRQQPKAILRSLWKGRR
jgi:GT2 family glycosyltransferase